MCFDTLLSFFVQNIEIFAFTRRIHSLDTRIFPHLSREVLATLAAITLENTGGMSASQNIM